MKNKMACVFAFILGAAVGSVASWKLLKTKYEIIAQEEIDSVKEIFAMHKGNKDVDAQDNEEFTDADKNELDRVLENEKYSTYSKKEKGDDDVEKPYVISPEEFGELDGYSTISLNYYADKVLADDDHNVISGDELAETVGTEFPSHFGEYEDDSVFVRNDRLRTDYEILLDTQKFNEG